MGLATFCPSPSSSPGMGARPYALMTTFPNRELADPSQTLEDAKLANAVVVQRFV